MTVAPLQFFPLRTAVLLAFSLAIQRSVMPARIRENLEILAAGDGRSAGVLFDDPLTAMTALIRENLEILAAGEGRADSGKP